MASLSDIRDAIKTTLELTIPDLTVYPTIPGSVIGAAVVVEPEEADFDVAMGRGTDTWVFSLGVLVPCSDLEIGQRELDTYVDGSGDLSIRQAIFGNRTLGLSDTNAHISGMSGYGGRHEAAGFDHIGATLRLIVHTRGTA